MRLRKHGNSASHPSLLRESEGQVYVEYLTLVCLVTLVGAVSVYSIGVPLLRTFQYAQLVLVMPLP